MTAVRYQIDIIWGERDRLSGRTVHYLIIDNLEAPEIEREGVLVLLGAKKDSSRARQQAIELVRTLWEEERLPEERFANGITEESIVSISQKTENPKLTPVEQGAVELCELLALQVSYQQACVDAAPLVPVVRAVVEEERALSAEELEIAKDKKTAKILQKVAAASADLSRFREAMSGNAKLILEVIQPDSSGDVAVKKSDSLG
ncbi:hypothetical protein IQ235_04130 [Oscillatoriales cyanobacterium LEGE 11467]|uniref:Uncharacterized protein n=1 Tax=Zarconia navalis LEGE 11467 TaxID=1828826 RepID=A0A928VTB5_9CYAN|nr:hypothetical protein [Zarconia navalis]MBE9039979.1 hypothetical protein [Zarconia navalis LEGE 11467]